MTAGCVMENYDFDKVIDRRGTNAYKWRMLPDKFGREDLLPLWVADMDFATPPFIVNALRERLNHEVMGYTVTPDGYWEVVARWIENHHGWRVPEEWFTYIPGIVKGIGMAVNVFLRPDEKVIIQPPVYHPFRLTPQGNGREVVFNPLRETPQGYEMDFENLAQVCDEKCKMLILSNPHNPAGIMWKRDALVRLADFCAARGVLVISDEIHCDMPLFGNHHVPFATVSDAAAQNSITFGAPSKTFNMAGIVSSYAIVPNAQLRRRFFTWLAANELNEPTFFSTIATMAAFREGEGWRREMLRYVEDNVLFVEDYCRQHMPQVVPVRPQASFLVWLDCRRLGLTQTQLIDLFVNRARLALNDGTTFGQEGAGFMRLNVGTPRQVLQDAMQRLHRAVRS